jgi:hypothetical protein
MGQPGERLHVESVAELEETWPSQVSDAEAALEQGLKTVADIIGVTDVNPVRVSVLTYLRGDLCNHASP